MTKDDQVALGSEASGETGTELHGEATVHQFWCPRHGDYLIKDARRCTVMVGRCTQCEFDDHRYNTANVGGRLGPMSISPAYRCNCLRANKRIATTGMWA